jgi:hypothetical protein
MVGIGKYIKGKSFSKMFAKKSPLRGISLGLISQNIQTKDIEKHDTDVDVDASYTDKSRTKSKTKLKNVGNQ